nr:MAG TPA: stabilization protein [Crassvirales sp.]
MKPKEIAFNIKGMKPDLDISKSESEFSFRNTNVQITQSSTNNMLVTDVGLTYDISETSIQGAIIGLIPFEDMGVLFTTDIKDRIYLVRKREVKLVFEGNLNLERDGCIEGVYYKEADSLSKVYWVDGRNPLRVMQIDWDKDYLGKDDTIFDINHTLHYRENLTIDKRFADGSFHSGTVQYFFTYFDKFGKESSIFKSSSLYYSTPVDKRAGSPEETCTNVFDITLTNLEYDNVRIYSLHRTSKDTTPSAYIVEDLAVVNGRVEYTDNNRGVAAIDPDILLYLGAEFFIPKTVTVKDNTMFLGNYQLPTIKDDKTKVTVNKHSKVTIPISRREQLDLSQREITFLKNNEEYPVVIQWLNAWGKPVGYSDITTITPNVKPVVNGNNVEVQVYSLQFDTNKDENIKAARVLIHYPEGSERRVITQGVLNPTVFNLRDRLTNSPYVQASWFFRPEFTGDKGIPFEHGRPVGMWTQDKKSFLTPELELFIDNPNIDLSNYEDFRGSNLTHLFGIDRSIVTINTPEIDEIVTTDNAKGIDLVGLCRINEGFFGYDTRLTDIDTFETTKGDFTIGYPYALSSFPTGLTVEYNPLYSIGSAFNRVGNIEGYSKKSDKNLLKTKTLYNYKRSRTTYDIDISGTLTDLIKTESVDEKLYKIGDKFYQGTVNTVVTNDISDSKSVGNYYVPKTRFDEAITRGDILTLPVYRREGKDYYNTKGVPVTYKSLPHMVAKIDSLSNTDILGYAHTDPSNRIKYSDQKIHIDVNAMGELFNKFMERNVFPRYDDIPYSFMFAGGTFKVQQVLDIYLNSVDRYTNKFLKKHLLDAVKSALNGIGRVEKPLSNNVFDTDTIPQTVAVNVENENTSSERIVIIPGISWFDVRDLIGRVNKYLVGKYNDEATIPADTVVTSKDANYHIAGINSNETVLFIADIINKNKTHQYNDLSWTVASDAYLLDDSGSLEIPLYGGDTYFQVYDCLKTIPYKDTDYNQVTEALSVALETRVNVYGRYDKNLDIYRFQNINEINFNKFNDVYSQKDNFLIYRKLEDWKLQNNFPNQVTWSKAKSNGEPIDTFTHYSLASTIDLDGSHGELTKLITFRDNVLFIQERGFGVIPFNSRVQIPVSDGVPIEITNGYKVDGYKYISDSIGSSLKGSIIKSLDYLYFYSDEQRELYQYSQGLQPLGIINGMSSALIPFFSSSRGFSSMYSIDHRVFFNSGNGQLVYNEGLGTFESFYTYPYSYFTYTTNSFIYSYFNRDVVVIPNSINPTRFDNVLPWEIEYKVNPSLNPVDRIFTNAEFVFDEDTEEKDLIPFDSLEIYNNYQYGSIEGMKSSYKPNATIKKFRFYNTLLPRDRKNRIDRIRSPWVKVKLKGLCDKKTNNLIKSFKIKYFE